MSARTGQCGCCGVDAQVARVLLNDGGVVGYKKARITSGLLKRYIRERGGGVMNIASRMTAIT